MDDGYAQRASNPPAFPEAPPAIFVASRSVMRCLLGSNDGWRDKKYAVVQPMIPPPITTISFFSFEGDILLLLRLVLIVVVFESGCVKDGIDTSAAIRGRCGNVKVGQCKRENLKREATVAREILPAEKVYERL